jgi:DNA-binding response OmpR family regulator
MNTIVVVDDDQVFSGLLRTVLELEGYQVVIVPWPSDVMPAVRRVMPVLVLMDVHTGRVAGTAGGRDVEWGVGRDDLGYGSLCGVPGRWCRCFCP